MPIAHELRPDGLKSKCGRIASPTLLIAEKAECKGCLSKNENYFHNYKETKRTKIASHKARGDGKSFCGKRLWGLVQASDIYTCKVCEMIAIRREIK